MANNDHLPPEVDLDKLCRDRSVFDSTDRMRDAGFSILRESKHEKVVVASHRSAPGFLFKKFLNDVSFSRAEQLAIYEQRVDGARALREHLGLIGTRRIVVPRKWLCDLPARSGSRRRPDHIVVVDRFDVLGREDSERRYRRIDRDQHRDLCTIFFAFRRVDFTAQNAPYLPDGKIAFIDTGYLEQIKKNLRIRRRSYDKNAAKLFTRRSRDLAASLWGELVERQDLLPASSERRF